MQHKRPATDDSPQGSNQPHTKRRRKNPEQPTSTSATLSSLASRLDEKKPDEAYDAVLVTPAAAASTSQNKYNCFAKAMLNVIYPAESQSEFCFYRALDTLISRRLPPFTHAKKQFITRHVRDYLSTTEEKSPTDSKLSAAATVGTQTLLQYSSDFRQLFPQDSKNFSEENFAGFIKEFTQIFQRHQQKTQNIRTEMQKIIGQHQDDKEFELFDYFTRPTTRSLASPEIVQLLVNHLPIARLPDIIVSYCIDSTSWLVTHMLQHNLASFDGLREVVYSFRETLMDGDFEAEIALRYLMEKDYFNQRMLDILGEDFILTSDRNDIFFDADPFQDREDLIHPSSTFYPIFLNPDHSLQIERIIFYIRQCYSDMQDDTYLIADNMQDLRDVFSRKMSLMVNFLVRNQNLDELHKLIKTGWGEFNADIRKQLRFAVSTLSDLDWMNMGLLASCYTEIDRQEKIKPVVTLQVSGTLFGAANAATAAAAASVTPTIAPTPK